METITSEVLKPREELSPRQSRDMNDGMAAAAAFWAASQQHPSYRPHNRCIYAALSVMDILHATGRHEAQVARLGLDLTMHSDDPFTEPRGLTIGHPASPKVDGLLNAHLVVRLGDILIDPSFAQVKRDWNSMPHFIGLLENAPAGHAVAIDHETEASAIAVYRKSDVDRAYQLAYFRLTRDVDLRTRNWRAAPDARPDRRAEVVHQAIEISLAEMSSSADLASAA
jgi:hypothetical protein